MNVGLAMVAAVTYAPIQLVPSCAAVLVASLSTPMEGHVMVSESKKSTFAWIGSRCVLLIMWLVCTESSDNDLSPPLSDLNECLRDDLNNCDQTCTNTVGSYTCGCTAGYQLASNGRTCNGKCSSICALISSHILLREMTWVNYHTAVIALYYVSFVVFHHRYQWVHYIQFQWLWSTVCQHSGGFLLWLWEWIPAGWQWKNLQWWRCHMCSVFACI